MNACKKNTDHVVHNKSVNTYVYYITAYDYFHNHITILLLRLILFNPKQIPPRGESHQALKLRPNVQATESGIPIQLTDAV